MTHICDMPTRRLTLCHRPARFIYYRGDRVLLGLCAQHDRTPGARLLRPRPWEYTEKIDLREVAR